MSEETFSLDEYEPEHDDVDEFLESDESPFDYKMSAAKGAIEHRQKAKGEKGTGTSTKGQHSMSHISDAQAANESVTQTVDRRRHGEVHYEVESDDNNNDPANW